MNKERYMEYLFPTAAFISAAITGMIFIFMVIVGLPLFTSKHVFHLLLKPWAPIYGNFGIYQMIFGSIAIASMAVIISFPLCLGYTALMTVYAPKWVQLIMKRVVILMSGVPTVVYGFIGIFLLVPFIREIFSYGSGLCVLSASLLLALVIAPTMILIFYQSFLDTPSKYLLAIDSMGGTETDRLIYGYLPFAWKGLITGLLLGMGRAIGDTLIALMIAGNAATIPFSPLDGARTLTSHIALVFAADYDSYEFKAIFACGIFLYIFTTTIVISIRYLINPNWSRNQ